MPEVQDPVCGMTFLEEEAEALGAFVLERGGNKHYLCSITCKQAYEEAH